MACRTGLDQYPFLMFALPVVVASWFGGLGPGLLATGLSVLTIDFFFLPPAYSFTLLNAEDTVSLAVFVIEGLAISVMGMLKNRALDFLQRSRLTLEQRIHERTVELQDANLHLKREMAERQRTLNELETANARLQASNRELQDFASVASHDLQEPLRKIQAFGDRLSRSVGESLSPEAADYLARMLNAARRMQGLIEGLLSFSRVTTRAQPFAPVDLGQTVREVLADLETRIEQSGAQVDVGELPVIEADPLQMRQLLQNLIGNALKFVREGVPPRIRVYGNTSAEGAMPPRAHGQSLELRVEDNGIGFEEKYLDRIFGVFQRLHGRDKYEGSGIGLAVCRKIVERHGGSITARSRPGEGSVFVVTLPVQQM